MVRRTQLSIIGAVALAAALVFPAHARGGQQAFTLSQWTVVAGQGHAVIEKQSWWLDSRTPDPSHTIVNPDTCCSWDINDHSDIQSNYGYLDGGASTSTPNVFGHIFDWNPIYSCRPLCANWSSNSNWYGATVTAPVQTLVVTVCFQPQGRCFTAPPHFDSNLNDYRYDFCGQALYDPGDPAIVDIPGSGGGMGVPTSIFLTVANPTTKRIRDINAHWGMSSDIVFGHGCPATSPTDIGSPYVIATDYPFRWVQ